MLIFNYLAFLFFKAVEMKKTVLW